MFMWTLYKYNWHSLYKFKMW